MFESDDWGMIRMASRDAYERLLVKGHPVDTCPYNRNDGMESNADMTALLETLESVRGADGKPAKFTLNNVVANPDFNKIKESGFTSYHFEPFTDTLTKYSETDKVEDLYREGISQGFFQVQFHGREHVNVNRWLSALENGDKAVLDAFEENMFTVPSGVGVSGRRDFLDTYGMAYEKEYEPIEGSIHSGLDTFENIWGFRSKSFIAPCYVWHRHIEQYLKKGGVKYIQGSHVQVEPKDGLALEYRKRYHYTGQKSELGMYYLVRNASFEPSTYRNREKAITDALARITIAFKWKKPAIISTHRLNYIGRHIPENRDQNLKLLEELLREIMRRYPDVVFMSSDELGDLISKN